MKNTDFLGEAVGVVLTASQTKEAFQIVSLILTIIATVFSILSRIIIWYRHAKKDGKITKEELEEGVKIIEDEISRKE